MESSLGRSLAKLPIMVAPKGSVATRKFHARPTRGPASSGDLNGPPLLVVVFAKWRVPLRAYLLWLRRASPVLSSVPFLAFRCSS